MSPDEFWALVDKGDPDECWPWRGPTNGATDPNHIRGRVRWLGRVQYAYRIAWELENGAPIPEGLMARHACDNPICVNPAHIEPGTAADNARDAKERGRVRTTPRYGMDHHAASVPPELVRQAVHEYLNGDERQADVAARYGVNQALLSQWARGQMRPDAGIPKAADGWLKLKPCGTRAAYERHRRNGEKPCEACRLGELEDQRRRRAQKRKSKAAA